MYALAASAAGVGMLALAQPAEAKIIYTKTNVNVFNYRGYPLDLNNDGTADFYLHGTCTDTWGACYESIGPSQGRDNEIWWGPGSDSAAALFAGARIGPKAPFKPWQLVMGHTLKGNRSYRGPWENGGEGVKNRYLGLRFKIKGKMHYGWARLNFPNPAGATLTGYAYETVPNKPIVAGKTKGPDVITVQPASLGHLAAGAPAIAAWRRIQSTASH